MLWREYQRGNLAEDMPREAQEQFRTIKDKAVRTSGLGMNAIDYLLVKDEGLLQPQRSYASSPTREYQYYQTSEVPIHVFQTVKQHKSIADLPTQDTANMTSIRQGYQNSPAQQIAPTSYQKDPIEKRIQFDNERQAIGVMPDGSNTSLKQFLRTKQDEDYLQLNVSETPQFSVPRNRIESDYVRVQPPLVQPFYRESPVFGVTQSVQSPLDKNMNQWGVNIQAVARVAQNYSNPIIHQSESLDNRVKESLVLSPYGVQVENLSKTKDQAVNFSSMDSQQDLQNISNNLLSYDRQQVLTYIDQLPYRTDLQTPTRPALSSAKSAHYYEDYTGNQYLARSPLGEPIQSTSSISPRVNLIELRPSQVKLSSQVKQTGSITVNEPIDLHMLDQGSHSSRYRTANQTIGLQDRLAFQDSSRNTIADLFRQTQVSNNDRFYNDKAIPYRLPSINQFQS